MYINLIYTPIYLHRFLRRALMSGCDFSHHQWPVRRVQVQVDAWSYSQAIDASNAMATWETSLEWPGRACGGGVER